MVENIIQLTLVILAIVGWMLLVMERSRSNAAAKLVQEIRHVLATQNKIDRIKLDEVEFILNRRW